jgi:hypothetical protein
MRQPVVLDHWPVHPLGTKAFTSIGSWRGAYGPVNYGGRTYGLRVHEFRRFLSLPRRSGERFEVAIDIHPDETTDLELLAMHGWVLADPREAGADPWAYRSYIQRSQAEFMVAKNMYVQARSGWFSERSSCYLASGRPVLAQDTDLGHLLPIGEGLLTFSTVDEAMAGVERIAADPDRHAKAARAIAEEHFDSNRVLPGMLERLEKR